MSFQENHRVLLPFRTDTKTQERANSQETLSISDMSLLPEINQ
jgi:hypothetical protein